MSGSGPQHVRERFARLACRGLPLERLVTETGRLLGRFVGADGLCLLTTDPATRLVTHELKEDDFTPEDSPRFIANEYRHEDFNKLVDLARAPDPVATLDGATGGTPTRSQRYLDLLEPAGYGRELRAVLSLDGDCWGALILFRALDSRDFAPDEQSVVTAIGPPLADAIKRSLLLSDARAELTPDAPGIVVLTASGEIASITTAGERWLEEIRDPGERGDLPSVVHALAQRARSRAGATSSDTRLPMRGGAASDPGPPARACVRGRSGVWLSLYGSMLGDAEDRAAVVIEAAHPSEVVPLVSRVYGLTGSQRRVVELVLRGLSTREIAQALHVSPLTVQDHLKAIFDRTGVRSRRELVAQVFYQQYLPRMAAGAQPSSTGWFNP